MIRGITTHPPIKNPMYIYWVHLKPYIHYEALPGTNGWLYGADEVNRPSMDADAPRLRVDGGKGVCVFFKTDDLTKGG